MLVGGGSGGHITPLLAVANQIKRDDSSAEVYIVTERFGKFGQLLDNRSNDFRLLHIFAGKLRRYHGETWAKRMFDLKTIGLNLRDTIMLAAGFFESIWLLARIRPKIVFIKGGYVGVPVGLACRLMRVSYITHDSDASAGLTNRLIGPGARLNAVGMPVDSYKYDPKKMVYVGVPVGSEYTTSTRKKDYKNDLGLNKNEQLILVLGGSNGAQRLDKIIHGALKSFLSDNHKTRVIHQVGRNNEDIYDDYPKHLRDRIETVRFLNPLAPYSKAADVIVSRAGATAIAEFAALKKAVILVPHPELVGGHQVENASVLERGGGALVLDEKEATEDPSKMKIALSELASSDAKRQKISKNLKELIPSNATQRLSGLLVDLAKGA